MSDLVLSNLTINGRPVGLFEPGQTFDSVTIGTQTWKNVNLAVDDGQGGVKIIEDPVYGTSYYYLQSAADRIISNISGWHLPSESDWSTLITYCGGLSVAGKQLKSTYGWTVNVGTDDYGFCALPLGCYWGSTSKFKNQMAFFRTSTSGGSYNKCVAMYNDYQVTISANSNLRNTDYGSVRLIKDT